MGSLMAGWDSPIMDEHTARSSDAVLSRSHNDVWSVVTPTTNQSPDEITSNSNTSGDWWTRSSWAFLNEPPRDETHTAHKYTAQFHVAQIHN
ncbi:DNA polymerase epsilon catalytic subunit A [Rhynchospora pubera]|uniref:DNA polymerase epsilon catalytic subunit A n=1 Tax=Rhynchospora pubera TaxID=906938 RepID=A0AAV8B9A8_9POAL|nr:DNA polymerase epsilon catalytic subunit A [Rhynchospora pubera]